MEKRKWLWKIRGWREEKSKKNPSENT